MKALSLKQPWAELILQGKKKVEIRKWNTKFRGEFLIHASSKADKEAMSKHGFKEGSLPTQAIVGRAKIIGVKKYSNKEEFKKDKGFHLATPEWGNHGFMLKDVNRIGPIPMKGSLGFWETHLNI